MNPNKKIGIILWVTLCLIGSIVYGLIFTFRLNSVVNFEDLKTTDIFFVIFILLSLSFTVTVPFVIYLLIRIKINGNKILRIKEYNIVLTLYSIILYFVFSNGMVSYVEGIELMTTYYCLGILSLNFYLRK